MQEFGVKLCGLQFTVPTDVEFNFLEFNKFAHERFPRIRLRNCFFNPVCLPVHGPKGMQLAVTARESRRSKIVQIAVLVIPGQTSQFDRLSPQEA
jgi:hypothetical protein